MPTTLVSGDRSLPIAVSSLATFGGTDGSSPCCQLRMVAKALGTKVLQRSLTFGRWHQRQLGHQRIPAWLRAIEAYSAGEPRWMVARVDSDCPKGGLPSGAARSARAAGRYAQSSRGTPAAIPGPSNLTFKSVRAITSSFGSKPGQRLELPPAVPSLFISYRISLAGGGIKGMPEARPVPRRRNSAAPAGRALVPRPD